MVMDHATLATDEVLFALHARVSAEADGRRVGVLEGAPDQRGHAILQPARHHPRARRARGLGQATSEDELRW